MRNPAMPSTQEKAMHQIRCSEIWGGIDSREEDLRAAGLQASLFSSAADGGRGGDIYYVSVCGEELLTRVAICDVVGHGERVSKVSSWLFDTIHEKMNDLNGASVLSSLNTVALEQGIEAMTTAAVISYYSKSQELTFSYAGHPPAWIWTKETETWERAEADCKREGPANIPLGVLDNTHYHTSHRTMGHGDRLVVFSDGILETPNENGELFGEKRVQSVLEDIPSDCLIADVKEALVSATRRHGQGSLAHDDVTLVAIEVD